MMKGSEIQTKLGIDNNHLNKQKDNHAFHRIGQLRRAKMQGTHLINTIDDQKNLSVNKSINLFDGI